MDGQKRTFRNDLLLICGTLVCAGILLLVLFLSRQNGGYAVVSVDGEVTARYPLSEDTEVWIDTGNGKNLLVIRNGAASVAETDCANQICVHTRAVKYDGETIVCLPHGLVIRIEGGDGGTDGSVR